MHASSDGTCTMSPNSGTQNYSLRLKMFIVFNVNTICTVDPHLPYVITVLAATQQK